MDDSLLPVTSFRENLTQTHLDFSYFRTTEPKLTPALRKMPFTNLRLTIWTGDLFHKQTIMCRAARKIAARILTQHQQKGKTGSDSSKRENIYQQN